MATAMRHQSARTVASPGAGRELRELLAPVTPAQFFAEYWGQRSLFIKGTPEKSQRLLPGGYTRADLCRAAAESARRRLKDFRLLAHKASGYRGGSRGYAGVFTEPGQIEAAVTEGCNIFVEQFADERVAAFGAALKMQLSQPADLCLVGTISPASFGWPFHLDAGDVFFWQCEGRKRFVISPEPAAAYPFNSIAFAPDGAVTDYNWEPAPWEEVGAIDPAKLIEVVLEPGDILYIPSGTVHGTEALDLSLTLNFTFEHVSFLDLLRQALGEVLRRDPNWRHLPRVTSAAAQTGDLPPEVADFFGARLAELRAALDGLTPTAPALNRQWQKMVANPGAAIMPSLAPPASRRAGPITRRTRLRLAPRGPITCARGTDEDGDPTLHVFYADKELSVAGEWVPFLERLIEQTEFTAEAATRWAGGGQLYAWAAVRDHLQALIAQGIVERA